MIRPRVRIVIGRSSTWSEEQHEAFRRLGATLRDIEIMACQALWLKPVRDGLFTDAKARPCGPGAFHPPASQTPPLPFQACPLGLMQETGDLATRGHAFAHPTGLQEYVAVLYWSRAASWTSAPEPAAVCLTLQMEARSELADAAAAAFPPAIPGSRPAPDRCAAWVERVESASSYPGWCGRTCACHRTRCLHQAGAKHRALGAVAGRVH